LKSLRLLATRWRDLRRLHAYRNRCHSRRSVYLDHLHLAVGAGRPEQALRAEQFPGLGAVHCRDDARRIVGSGETQFDPIVHPIELQSHAQRQGVARSDLDARDGGAATDADPLQRGQSRPGRLDRGATRKPHLGRLDAARGVAALEVEQAVETDFAVVQARHLGRRVAGEAPARYSCAWTSSFTAGPVGSAAGTTSPATRQVQTRTAERRMRCMVVIPPGICLSDVRASRACCTRMLAHARCLQPRQYQRIRPDA
jgi:hypothetical protein